MILDKLHDFILLERDKCPWASKQSLLDIVKEIRGKLDEFEVEITNNPKNRFYLAEELADVFSDVMLLLHIDERDNEIKNINEIF